MRLVALMIVYLLRVHQFLIAFRVFSQFPDIKAVYYVLVALPHSSTVAKLDHFCYVKGVKLFDIAVCWPGVLSLVWAPSPPAPWPGSFLPPVSAVSPLKVEEFSKELANHPDQQQVFHVLQGLQHGFRLGFQSAHKLKPAKRNKLSALHHAHIVDAYLAKEVSLGRVAGPFSASPFPHLHISSFGVIPKKGQPGKWHLIVDLSSPGGASVNDGINPLDYSLQYIKVDQVIRMVSHYGRAPLWLNSMWNPLIGTSQFIQGIASYWA